MRITTLTVASSLAGALLFGGCSTPAPQQPAQPVAKATPPPSGPPVSINAEMVALVDHAAHALWDAEIKGKAPKTNNDWENIAEHATQLAAAGSLITLPGSGPNDITLTQQPNWQKWSRGVSDAGMAALKASQTKSMEGLLAANNDLVAACEGCHKEYKPSLPSEGITHKHMH
jgi:hypothetical protein